ncbi:hypothetical protein L226DRAFT_535035 [Lentinus tigrinus ALCF2SS1-7]|uniref:Uncharacterized protein n=1 Tax=Lentinus tigrinus ALCF2SS1-6 TaxID=1328759 RepID=A0A5C2SA06_9APHY|nr:hypothetical protein L227DRAFT_575633 [Lentinus tigrinus ALCF2SS1-6]RPD74811.1 hypothetical protein L226DRAFT_535035 [Lentinus tigrinus ALCF2SS1-7]
MYSSRTTYGSPPPELSNNPFIDHPANAMARYPDITGSDDPTSSQYTSWLNKPSTSSISTNSNGYYGGQGPTTPQGYGSGYQPQPQATGWGQGSGFSQPQQQQSYNQAFSPPPMQSQSSGMPFQPSSSFGQQLAAQVGGAYTGMPAQQQYTGYAQSPQYGQGYQQGYPGQQPQQQQQQPPQYLSEFDPYAAGQNSNAPTPGGAQTPAGSGYGQQHPREYVQRHKAELESWDSYSWKQVQNSFDELKRAWESRKGELEARLRALGGAGLFGVGGYGGGMYGGPAQQYAQIENMAKEAGMHVDSIAASSFQMQEVFSGYRQSGDIASKRRVRESINAALTSLPDWPQPLTF